MAVAGLLSLMATWWSSPLDRAAMNQYGTFDQRDIVPIGYAAFALTAGVCAGMLIRRTLPAVATTLAAFVVTRLAVIHWIRPRLITPAVRNLALNPAAMGVGSNSPSGPDTLQPDPPNIPDAWIYSTQIVAKTGHPLTARIVASACPHLGGSGPDGGQAGRHATQVPASAQQALQHCVAKIGATYHEVVIYQPATRYWTFQWYELAIYLGTALILARFCFWQVRRRLT
ncbi:MAG: hypothetical protein ACRDPY_05905 [Streptosporangiaceae bacterium]